MANLNVDYLGLTLKNPIIVSSSGLTSTLERVKKVEEAGAGAVVLKSLFEEQMSGEAESLEWYHDYPEAADYLSQFVKQGALDKYLQFIRDTKQECSIPVIASICCFKSGEWEDFARKIEAAGADALELNIFLLPDDENMTADKIEQSYLKIVEEVCQVLTIPVAVKIGNHFTNPVYIVNQIYCRGAKGVVMFNRFYEPDIDIDAMNMIAAPIFSSATELRNSLRWLALSSAHISAIDLSASTGIWSGQEVVKVLLTGAKTAQVCSVLYKDGLGEIQKMLTFLEEWMDKNSYKTIEEFRASMNLKNVSNPVLYERSQFMKYFASIE